MTVKVQQYRQDISTRSSVYPLADATCTRDTAADNVRVCPYVSAQTIQLTLYSLKLVIELV
uniref:Uncharacterized protein n=1 Tax=Arion vulgaris TaxID=1028688 RepID=A0A0B7AFX8_9EUPU